MIRIHQLKLPIRHTQKEMEEKIGKILRISPSAIQTIRMVRQSVDARKKEEILYIYSVDVETEQEDKLIRQARNRNVGKAPDESYHFPEPGTDILSDPPVIIGAGPAGLFCALMLARSGYRPLVLERGESVEKRQQKVACFWAGGALDLSSNVQFGEGGAGTFSDGKLNTLVKDKLGRNQKVLETFVEFGGDKAILYQSKPHIGTDVLSHIVAAMREEIIQLGGSIRFLNRVTDLMAEDGHVSGLLVNETEFVKAEAIVLAIGHSARDTFEMLDRKGIPISPKAFAVGLRIQHPQEMINMVQYGPGNEDILGPASYKLTHQASNGRGIYSFCMCPGGYVVNASSEERRLAVNGMSCHARDGLNANSALIVTITPEDFPDSSPLSGISYQRRLEAAAYQHGQGGIPIQLYGDFKEGRISSCFGQVQPQIKGGYAFANIKEMLPDYVSQALLEGIEAFGRTLPGFDRWDAILAGVESRTSSPVRIERDSHFESPLKGLFPCGEGAGYAGGITSAAMDGIRIAEEICRRYRPFDHKTS
ncbi:FAD-dependent protein [Lachnospiraceae bacterium 62-35]